MNHCLIYQKKFKMKKSQKGKKLKGLSLHVLPFAEMKDLNVAERVKKILNLVLGNKIVILHGRLKPEEETRLIEDTMAMVDHVRNFKGVELAVIEPDLKSESLFIKLKYNIAKRLVGDSSSITVIGPAAVIREIQQDPKKLELMLN